MSILIALAGLSVLGSTTSGTEAQAAPQPQPTQAADQDAPEPRRICRTFDDSATRLNRRRVCLTREQWRARDAS